MYTFDSRVRYSETDEHGRLSVAGIINYMQDCSTFQSEDARVGVRFLDRSHRAWLLSSWRIVIDRYPRLGERLTAGTWPCGFKGIYGYRNFVLKDEKGDDFVRAASVWFLYDTENSVPLRVQPEDIAPYGPQEPALVLGPAPKRIHTPEKWQEGRPIVVERRHIDTNHHVNNAQYVDMARESIPQGLKIREIRADYKKAAVLEDVLTPRVSWEEHAWTVALCGEKGENHAVVWLRAESQESDL